MHAAKIAVLKSGGMPPALAAPVAFVPSGMAALATADALVIVTVRKEFRTPDIDAIAAALADQRVFDGRNMHEPAMVRSFGLGYHSIGRA